MPITVVHLVMNDSVPLCVEQVPVVAVMTTAGGVRSMTSMFGSLLALQELGVLDCVSYISGLSATTWTMAKLYEDANWSQKDLGGPIGDIRKRVIKSKLHCFSLDHLKYYEKELCERKQEGHKLSFTDLWGLFIDCMLHHEVLYIHPLFQRISIFSCLKVWIQL